MRDGSQGEGALGPAHKGVSVGYRKVGGKTQGKRGATGGGGGENAPSSLTNGA